MKRIINGKKYDTETATLIDDYQVSNPSDFNYVYEALYLKKTGEYFLYGEGGANSKYRKNIALNEWSGGEKITPLTEEEAKAWVEAYNNADYEDIFGEVEE